SRKEPASYLNIMVVGPSGSGKTVFVRTLCERMKQNIVPNTYKESKPMVLKEPLRNTEELYSVSMHIEENGQRTALTIIDTPGFSNSFTFDHQLRYIAKYIDHQFECTLVEETKVKRDAKAVDTHIHACLYFIDTNGPGLNDTDRYVIKLLSSRVNILPVIGKADVLSINQRAQFKKQFRKDIFDVLQIPIYGYISTDEDEEVDSKDNSITVDDDDAKSDNMQLVDSLGSTTIARIVELLQETIDDGEDEDGDARAMIDYLEYMPYCLIGYEEDVETGPVKTILGRRYPWAIVECCNPEHCDFEKLRTMLLTEHRDMLRIDTFERFYEQYRTEQL
ncbi:Septin-type guanine nucleotide-binding (G) domain-containing protein, partial [Radiomyces spectabilis]|uniref:Septin-type guanine nucleotide-binding (G) domain-containing protein n=1 Tax=Radiomyces spectabilis TaxID=64574 RepID=UPI00221E6B25